MRSRSGGFDGLWSNVANTGLKLYIMIRYQIIRINIIILEFVLFIIMIGSPILNLKDHTWMLMRHFHFLSCNLVHPLSHRNWKKVHIFR